MSCCLGNPYISELIDGISVVEAVYWSCRHSWAGPALPDEPTHAHRCVAVSVAEVGGTEDVAGAHHLRVPRQPLP
jgi:hypothetical protein